MPIYTYRCRQCGIIEEHVVSYQDRDKPMQHEGPNGWDPPAYKERCGGSLEREEGLEVPTVGKPSFEGGAILESGAKVPGRFGKLNRKKGGWYRP